MLRPAATCAPRCGFAPVEGCLWRPCACTDCTRNGALHAVNLGFPSGYGFTAIIVAFLGRLHPIGVLIAGVVLAITFVGGQVAQTTVKIPNATAGIFQALMLFLILASDVLVRNRIRIVRNPRASAAPAVVAGE